LRKENFKLISILHKYLADLNENKWNDLQLLCSVIEEFLYRVKMGKLAAKSLQISCTLHRLVMTAKSIHW